MVSIDEIDWLRSVKSASWFLGRAVSMKDGDGKTLRWVGTCTDINDQKLAQEASQLKSQFLANMSHEIRTPLNGVVGMSHLLHQTKLTHTQKEYIGLVIQSATHLQYVVNDILDLSKIESNRLHLDLSVVELNDLITRVYSTLKHSADSKKIKLKMKITSKEGFKFYGDSIRLQQVLLNLVQNAIKFTESGFVEMRFQNSIKSGGKAVIRFEVEDSGVGIKESALQSIFEPFTQADNSITRNFGGTGLGLSICKNLIELMGGTIGVESKFGKGSVFYFEIPVDVISKQVKSTKSKMLPAPKAVRSLHILVAEDHPINQKVVARMLENFGHHVDIVHDGVYALNAIKKKSYDIILMDCHMPNLDGFSASQEIRQLGGPMAKMPIIALTADALTETRKKCFDSGMSGYVSKPINAKSLFLEIEKLTNNKPIGKHLIRKKRDIKFDKTVILDENAIEKLRLLNKGDSDDFALELVQDFLNKSPSRLSAIGQNLSVGNLQAVYQEAHALKSAAAAIGANMFAFAAENLEASSRANSTKKSERDYLAMLKAFQTSHKTLERFCVLNAQS